MENLTTPCINSNEILTYYYCLFSTLALSSPVCIFCSNVELLFFNVLLPYSRIIMLPACLSLCVVLIIHIIILLAYVVIACRQRFKRVWSNVLYVLYVPIMTYSCIGRSILSLCAWSSARQCITIRITTFRHHFDQGTRYWNATYLMCLYVIFMIMKYFE
jgi:hypothetical protein